MKPIQDIVRETNYILKMMREAVFGHRPTTYTKKDTDMLHNKVREPWTDQEREDHMNAVEPLMNKKQHVMPGRDSTLDRYLDIDTRVSRADYLPSPDDEEEDTDIESQFDKIDISNLK